LKKRELSSSSLSPSHLDQLLVRVDALDDLHAQRFIFHPGHKLADDGEGYLWREGEGEVDKNERGA
jgi:hypothetical protein